VAWRRQPSLPITHSKLDGDMERLSKRLDTLYRDTDLEKVRERL
jgi:hypothetical protein